MSTLLTWGLAVIGALGTALKWLLSAFQLRNTKAMQEEKQRQQDQEIKDAAAEAIRKQDLDEIRRQCAE